MPSGSTLQHDGLSATIRVEQGVHLQVVEVLQRDGHLGETTAVWLGTRKTLAAMSLLLLDPFGGGGTAAHVDPVGAVTVAAALKQEDIDEQSEACHRYSSICLAALLWQRDNKEH